MEKKKDDLKFFADDILLELAGDTSVQTPLPMYFVMYVKVKYFYTVQKQF